MTDDQSQVLDDAAVQDEPEEKEEMNEVGESLLAVQGLIERLSGQLDTLMREYKEKREMLNNIFTNDESLQKAEEQAKEVTQQMKDRKGQLNESAEVKELKAQLGELKEDLNLVQESLNTHLINYFQMTGSKAIDMSDGREREIVLHAKLKPRKNE